MLRRRAFLRCAGPRITTLKLYSILGATVSCVSGRRRQRYSCRTVTGVEKISASEHTHALCRRIKQGTVQSGLSIQRGMDAGRDNSTPIEKNKSVYPHE